MTESNSPDNSGAGQELSGRVALITGSGRGIGKNIARVLGESGATAVVADINPDAGAETVAEFQSAGITAAFREVDLSLSGEPQRLVQQTINEFGSLDILVNCARSGRAQQRATLLTEDETSWDEMFSVTLRALFFMCQAAVAAWEAAGTRGGVIVNISSITATLAAHESPSYHVAKAGVEQLTRYLAASAGPLGVRINAVAPGFIVQDEHQERFARDDNVEFRRTVNLTHPLREPGRSDDIAEAVRYLASDRSRWVSGQTIIVDGGASIQEHWTLLDRNMRPQ